MEYEGIQSLFIILLVKFTRYDYELKNRECTISAIPKIPEFLYYNFKHS